MIGCESLGAPTTPRMIQYSGIDTGTIFRTSFNMVGSLEHTYSLLLSLRMVSSVVMSLTNLSGPASCILEGSPQAHQTLPMSDVPNSNSSDRNVNSSRWARSGLLLLILSRILYHSIISFKFIDNSIKTFLSLARETNDNHLAFRIFTLPQVPATSAGKPSFINYKCSFGGGGSDGSSGLILDVSDSINHLCGRTGCENCPC
ncbi:hypothetical protein C8Q75DRAFT_578385 [Abortiporus biennis]|nr:hypothetical protein C8Q75DRAFT_578385 [Abortiporus biennis]